MKPEVEKLLELAAAFPAGRRAELLAEACPDPAVRAEVESLLHYGTGAESYFSDAIRSVARSLRSSHEASPGDGIGCYRIISLIGRGGMGSVYLAERADGEIQQRVAVKLLRADVHRPVWLDRFRKERQLLASLQHPSIVRVIDAGQTADDRPFLIMEYVEGIAIDTYAAGIDVRDRLKLFLRVCEGVSHAHQRLIIHCDLKPSNILVDRSGLPKLLDFGIARLVDEEGDATQTVERLLTPAYASPEQLAGGTQTTATDVYSLGAVLYKLLTGRAPRESGAYAAQAMEAIAGNRQIAAPSCLNPDVPTDLDYVLRKALRSEQEERYVSVEAFARDIRAFLELRPVEARSGNTWYRMRKFLRRYWMPAAAAAIAVASLSAGLYVANRQRTVAQRRFQDVRALANKLFDIDNQVRQLAGSSKSRQLIVDTSLDYLRRLAAEARGDPDLALDVANAYMRVARVQGVPTSVNLGQMDQAEQSLAIAERFVASVLAAQPANRMAMLRSAQITHDRMVLAKFHAHYDEARVWARKSTEWLEKFHARESDRSEGQAIMSTYLAVAQQDMEAQQFEDALRLCRRAAGLARSLNLPSFWGNSLWVSAEVYRRQGDLDRALHEIQESVKVLDPGPDIKEPVRQIINFEIALSYEGKLLGEDLGVSMGRTASAIATLDRAFAIADRLVHQDPNDQFSRNHLADAGINLADILRHTDARRGLEIYDHTLRHLAEVKNNSSFRRFEVSALVGSSYPLRHLGRPAEARQRLDAAFDRLRQLGFYPVNKVKVSTLAEDALGALADCEAGVGNLHRGIEIYRRLTDDIQGAEPTWEANLVDAVRLSRIYEAEETLARRARQADLATTLEDRRRNLWQYWDRKLPNNAFVRRQFDAARTP